MNGWANMPKESDEYKYDKMLCGSYEAFAYESLGLMEFTKEGVNNATLHMKKAFEIYNLFGMTDALKQVETRIAFMHGANNEDVSLSTLQTFKKNYDDSISENGMNSIVTISAGMCYGMSLWEMGHYIEGERLMTKLATTSRRVLGPEHNITINADKSLKQFKGRYVIVLPESGEMYQALRYDNDGQVCVIQGPISDPRQVDDEGIHHTAHNLVIPTNGCPVICHGLVSASHLNGELGVVRNIKENVNGIRLAVHFDQMNLGLGSALVKPENLRVAFELPSCSNEEVVILQPPIVD